MVLMAKTTRPGKDAPPKEKKNFTIWAKTTEDADRIERAVASAAKRAGFSVSASAWMLAQVMKGVEEEERRMAEEAQGNGKKEGGRKT